MLQFVRAEDIDIMTMRKFAQLSLAFVGAVAITACANDGTMDTTTGATGTTGTAGTSIDIDRDFINDQLEDGDAEVRLGRLADERATNADVKAFGRMMVEEHTMAGTELKRIAGQHNAAPSLESGLEARQHAIGDMGQ